MKGLGKGFKDRYIAKVGDAFAFELVKLDELFSLVGNVFGCEPKVFHESTALSRGAKTFHTDLGMGESVPSMNCGGLDGKSWDIPGQDACLILLRLLQEEFLAWHTDQSGGDTLRHQGLDGLGRESDL